MNPKNRRESGNARKRSVLDQILLEREYQQNRWDEQDKTHSLQDWLGILTFYLGRAAYEIKPHRETKNGFKKRLIQIAAICVAALEALDDE